ncbi:hypothetical protein [Geodermatophilus africanus]|uniref:hypothetical protein n=1 Tax=Geodermatophilus africanus TaxID=1137993 RepID=UPI000B8443FA
MFLVTRITRGYDRAFTASGYIGVSPRPPGSDAWSDWRVLHLRHTSGRALIDRKLHLPRAWVDDRDRARAAGIDDAVPFTSKSSWPATCSPVK